MKVEMKRLYVLELREEEALDVEQVLVDWMSANTFRPIYRRVEHIRETLRNALDE